MSETEISVLADETREWVRRLRARVALAATAEQGYRVEGSHVTVGDEKPLTPNFLSTTEAAEQSLAVA